MPARHGEVGAALDDAATVHQPLVYGPVQLEDQSAAVAAVAYGGHTAHEGRAGISGRRQQPDGIGFFGKGRQGGAVAGHAQVGVAVDESRQDVAVGKIEDLQLGIRSGQIRLGTHGADCFALHHHKGRWYDLLVFDVHQSLGFDQISHARPPSGSECNVSLVSIFIYDIEHHCGAECQYN